MSVSLDRHWEAATVRPNRLQLRVLRVAQEICTPANLALCLVVALAWLALVGWTGAGQTGWQARLCADLDLQPRACALLPGASS
ncbi:hypothetical protein HNR00_004409 [Methylorubrum rhodinum]|uniref:Uncharacterized protein n=1 Tax=Methylorubrum rhodinum TaxID=29428 RepID=A0A840ZRL5_9HYPH|nr:hypothetical protein [Methylorubrum rhodinum]MBB5759675.1 hypothetical protein [Methylorubrum rhodinum]